MYGLLLTLHTTTRWLVLAALLWALARLWSDALRERPWSAADHQAGTWLANSTSVQFVFGLLLFVFPYGLAQSALGNLPAALRSPDLWFVGIVHPLLTSVAVGLTHIGRARARRATTDHARYRWALGCFSVAALVIVLAIPWWRPLLRGL